MLDDATQRRISRLRQGEDRLPLRDRGGRSQVREHAFEGCCRTWSGAPRTDSVVVREELAKFRNVQALLSAAAPAAARGAQRQIAQRTIAEISACLCALHGVLRRCD